MTTQRKLPQWLKVRVPGGANYKNLQNLLRREGLHTVCEEAHCPNIGECWNLGTATFMILGDTCTRACRYCAVKTGTPIGLDLQEPIRLGETVQNLNLNYVVITSVNRDDLPDGGAFIFAQCIHQIRRRLPNCKIEVLTPDFEGNWNALKEVINASPDTFNHNIETVERVFHRVRPKGNYITSLEVLKKAKMFDDSMVTKSGLMVGLGETWDEITQTLRDLRSVDCDLLTIGQYLRPSKNHAPLMKWYTPGEFLHLKTVGEDLGFSHVASGPLVRSSYHADEQYRTALATGVS